MSSFRAVATGAALGYFISRQSPVAFSWKQTSVSVFKSFYGFTYNRAHFTVTERYIEA